MESSGGTGHAVQFAPRREETMWQHFLVVTQEATTEKISDVITKKFSPTTNQPTNLIPHYKGVMCV